MPLNHPDAPERLTHDLAPSSVFAAVGDRIPRDALPEGELPADVAYQIIQDELMLDGNARLNLAAFVSSWMEPQAQKLMVECFDKNMIDKDEYPQTAEIEARCVSILGSLWHAPGAPATGCSIFWVNYLGDNMPAFVLNLSRPGAQVVGQYYNFLRLGFDGYRRVQQHSRDVATRLSAQIANYTVFDVSNAMRERGWQTAGVHVPGEPHRPRGAARRRQGGLQPRHGGHARRRPRAPAAATGAPAGADPRRRDRHGLQPLMNG